MAASGILYSVSFLRGLRRTVRPVEPLLKSHLRCLGVLRMRGRYRGKRGGRNLQRAIGTVVGNRHVSPSLDFTCKSVLAKNCRYATTNNLQLTSKVVKQIDPHPVPDILVCNARSICNKKHELEATIDTYSTKIACITESWASTDVPDHVLSLPGFQLFRKDRLCQKGGGLVTYISNVIPARRVQDLEVADLEVMWIEVRPLRLPRIVPFIAIGVVYHPPCRNNKEGNDHILSHLVNTIDVIHRRQPQAGVLLCGDVNRLPLRRLQAAHPSLKQIVKQPTRGTATLDVVITNLAQLYHEPQIIAPIGRSDHACVVLQARTQVDKQPPAKRLRRLVTYANKTRFALDIATTDWAGVIDATSVEEKVGEFYDIVMGLVKQHFPAKVKSVRTNDKGWMTERVKRAISQRQEEFQRHGKSPKWKQLRNKVKTVIQQAKGWHYRNCIQQLKQENPRRWWSCINRELGRSQKSRLPASMDGTPPGQVAETISQHFSEAWCQGEPLYMFPLPLGEPGPELCSIGEVKSLLKSVKSRKSCGPDSLPNWILKEFADDLAPIVAHLFNASYEEGTVPLAWKSANVVPVPKCAGASRAQDMRPVSLLSVLAKLLERCILRRLLPSILPVIKDQYAYVKGSSTTIALVRMVQTWLTALDSNKPTLVRAIFADMSKAFDRVDHALLLQRVMDIQASPRMQRWIFSYLQNRRQRVVLDDVTSPWLTLTSGVPQGGVLSLYLFLLFMSSRTTVHHDTTNVGYADDVGLSRTLAVPTADLDTTVAEETSHLDCWAEENRMILNGSKSQLLQICFSKSVPTPPSITLGGQPVPSVGSAKGLGFILDRNLSFNEQVTAMTSKASRRLHYLRLLTKQGTSVTDLVQIYLALVRPVLEYCHVLLVGCGKEQEMAIERVQRRALRIISLGGRRSVPDLPTLKTRREEAAVHLFERMLRDDHPLNDLVPPTRSAATGLSLRNAERISLPPARTKRLRNSFLHCAIRLYNNRPTLDTQ
ncbi:hypothetical protein Bbelb_283730 [Branchiostoma belcheri]|nr:hypothetical protein Bbelb_283730 [Branchiostoma belcheri]